jgi:hypothetical protein
MEGFGFREVGEVLLMARGVSRGREGEAGEVLPVSHSYLASPLHKPRPYIRASPHQMMTFVY